MKQSEQKLHMKDDAKQKWPSQEPVSALSKVERSENPPCGRSCL